MRRLDKRVGQLEGRVSGLLERRTVNIKKWHRIIPREDQTQDEAVTAYEAENEPVGDDGVLLRVIIRKQ